MLQVYGIIIKETSLSSSCRSALLRKAVVERGKNISQGVSGSLHLLDFSWQIKVVTDKRAKPMHVALKHGPWLQSFLKEDWPPRPQATAKV